MAEGKESALARYLTAVFLVKLKAKSFKSVQLWWTTETFDEFPTKYNKDTNVHVAIFH